MNTNEHYGRQVVLDKLSSFNAELKGTTVSTYLDENVLGSAEVSKQYKLFNFRVFMTSILESLETVMELDEYRMRIKGGMQEISLFSKPLLINGDPYRTSFYILNSTDRTRALQFTAGLYRVRDNIEIVMPVAEAATHIKFVHKGKDFENKVQSIYAFLEQFPKLVTEQREILTDLATKRISLRKLYHTMLYENANVNIPALTSIVRGQAFAKNMLSHPTDKLDVDGMNLSQDDLFNLRRPSEYLRAGKTDIEVNAYQALHWYVNVYRNRDISIIRRECARYYDYIAKIGTEPETEKFTDKYRKK